MIVCDDFSALDTVKTQALVAGLAAMGADTEVRLATSAHACPRLAAAARGGGGGQCEPGRGGLDLLGGQWWRQVGWSLAAVSM